MGSLLKQSLHSVHVVIKNAYTAISDPNMELIDFLNTSPAQVQYTELNHDIHTSYMTLYVDSVSVYSNVLIGWYSRNSVHLD